VERTAEAPPQLLALKIQKKEKKMNPEEGNIKAGGKNSAIPLSLLSF